MSLVFYKNILRFKCLQRVSENNIAIVNIPNIICKATRVQGLVFAQEIGNSESKLKYFAYFHEQTSKL